MRLAASLILLCALAPVASPAPAHAAGNADGVVGRLSDLGGEGWTGLYAGLPLGRTVARQDGDRIARATRNAWFVGYDTDLGRSVLGVEIDRYTGDMPLPFGTDRITAITRLKGRLGHDAGRVLAYATLGLAHASTTAGNGNGWVAGIGADYLATDHLAVGVEYLHHRFADTPVGAGDLRLDTLSLRLSVRF